MLYNNILYWKRCHFNVVTLGSHLLGISDTARFWKNKEWLSPVSLGWQNRNKCCGKERSSWHSHFWYIAVLSFPPSCTSIFCFPYHMIKLPSSEWMQDHINSRWSKGAIVTDYKAFKQCWRRSNKAQRLRKCLVSQNSERN